MQVALYKNAQATDLLTVLQVPEAQAVIAGYSVVHTAGKFTIGDKSYLFWGQDMPRIYQGSSIPSDVWGESFTGWILPDPDNDDHYIYTATGARIKYRHTLNGTTGGITFEYPETYDGTTYTRRTDPDLKMVSDTYNRTLYRPVFYLLYAPVARCLDWDNSQVYVDGKPCMGPSYIPFIKYQIIGTGNMTDPSYKSVTSLSLFDTSAVPDAYKPTKNTRRGGKGVGSYHGAVNGERPDIATRNAVTTFGGSGDGLTYYQLGSIAGLHRCINYAYELGVLRDNQYIRDAMVSAYLLPVLTIDKSSASGVRIADNTINDFDPLMSIYILDQEHISEKKSCYYDFGELDGWGDKIDFTNTQLTLFLPFVGSVNIDINACQYGSLTVDYYIDVYNGNIIYYVYTQSLDSPTDTLYGTYTGNCAIEIPLCGAGQSGSVLGKITNAVSALAVGAGSIAAGNPVAALNAAAGMTDAVIPHYNVDRSGSLDTNGVSLNAWRISLKISMPVELREETQDIIGHASYFRCKMSDLPAGRHVITAVDVDTISGATVAEKEEIKAILERGVFIK